MDEERDEDGDAETGIGVVGGKGDEALGEFVEQNRDAELEAKGVVQRLFCVFFHLLMVVVLVLVLVLRVLVVM